MIKEGSVPNDLDVISFFVLA